MFVLKQPTRQPTVSRKQAVRLVNRSWSVDECASRRRRSTRCNDLNEGVCSMRERSIVKRFGESAIEVCKKVGLIKSMYYEYGEESLESADEEYELYYEE